MMLTLRIWLSKPSAYAVLAPLVTIAGAITTIIAPMMLEPASFGTFILLMALFQYIADFDLGFSRLVDSTFSKPSYDMNELHIIGLARFMVATIILVMVMIAAIVTDSALTLLAGFAGAAFMLSNGPLSYYRATQNVFAFTMAALLMQIGLSIPRLVGLLSGGVTGCMVALCAWYLLTAIVLNIRFMQLPNWSQTKKMLWPLFVRAFPLFLFGALWPLYLFGNRWISSTLSNQTDAGLFGFGANLVVIGVSVFGLVSQAYYPRHLAATNKNSLCKELFYLMVLVMGGVITGVFFSRFGLQYIFPHFKDAASSTAVSLISGIPLCMCSWIIPLIIARSTRPWREATAMFSITLLVLYGTMWFGSSYGVVGQAFGCLPAALLLLWLQLYLVVRNNFLSIIDGFWIGIDVILACLLVGVVWYDLFI